MPVATAVSLDPIQTKIPAAGKVVGLDTIRFVCAVLVMLLHIQFLPERLHGNATHPLQMVLIGIYNCLFNGFAAVIVFFLISGFCINFPYKSGRAVRLGSFYCRRFIRILLPAAVFLFLRWFVVKDTTNIQQSVLWSIVCEGIYYSIFPMLLFVRRKTSWLAILGASTLGAAVVIGMHWNSLSDGDYIALGWLTWIIGLPCWILGCWLSETYSKFPLLSSGRIWLLRLGMYGLSVLLGLVHYHAGSKWVSNCILLDLFAVPAFLWLGYEIVYANEWKPVDKLEWAGSWSYSLYLAHPLVGPLLGVAGLSFLDLNPSLHFLLLPLALLAGYGFYRAIELPSHRLAVWAGRALERQTAR